MFEPFGIAYTCFGVIRQFCKNLFNTFYNCPIPAFVMLLQLFSGFLLYD